MKKTIFTLMVAAVCLLAFSACSGNGSSSSSLSVSDMPSSGIVASSNTANHPSIPASETSSTSIQPSSSGEQPVAAGDAALGDFVGSVTALTAEGFTCNGSTPELSEDEAYVTIASDQNITVIYDTDVKFTKCLYNTSDDTSEIVPATKEDVVEGKTVTLWGRLDGETFTATVVQVLEPVS